jgi:hypothetical protein
MCMCGKPTINGGPGYSWNGEARHVRPIDPPDLREGDKLIYDEPGRCGGLDSHAYHLRVVKAEYGGHVLLVRHGGGDEAINLGVVRTAIDALAILDSNARYWLLLQLFHVQSAAKRDTAAAVGGAWRKAAAEKRIKTRRSRGGVKVWIAEEAAPC